ncbi:MAG: hypothetical protein IJI54_14215 [Kiritimatiellae bacterium]|nr:hypothetical protein [Kiritimatiellia bacterium]
MRNVANVEVLPIANTNVANVEVLPIANATVANWKLEIGIGNIGNTGNI